MTHIKQLGGGKRAKADTNNEIKQGDIPNIYVPPLRQPNDVPAVVAALAVTNVNIGGWLESLNIEDLTEVQNKFDNSIKSSSHIDKHVHALAGFIKEYADLVVT